MEALGGGLDIGPAWAVLGDSQSPGVLSKAAAVSCQHRSGPATMAGDREPALSHRRAAAAHSAPGCRGAQAQDRTRNDSMLLNVRLSPGL